MQDKFLAGDFGKCPRVWCKGQNGLPMGLDNEIGCHRVKMYCPRCKEVYSPKKKCRNVDGAYFGVSFPHLFLSKFPQFADQPKMVRFCPRIYGFRIYNTRGSKYFSVD